MTLEQQVPSLEFCKRLKELGYPQESIFWWVDAGSKAFLTYAYNPLPEGESTSFIPAPTVAELGEALPYQIETDFDFYYFHSIKKSDHWFLSYENDLSGSVLNNHFERDTEANARASMWIYLKENNLLPTR